MSKKEAKIIAFFNQKGGVAKTTSCYNIAVSLANKGKKVLVVDLDSQANLTICAGLEPFAYENTIASVLSNEGSDINSAIINIKNNLDLIPSRLELSELDTSLISRVMRETVLKRALNKVLDNYDFILLDCPPNLSIITTNALACSDYVLVPVKTDYLAYRGVELVFNSIKGIQSLTNPNIEILGIIATMYEKNIKDDQEILSVLEEEYNLIGVIKKLAVAKKGIAEGKSAIELAKNDISTEYNKISDYIINKGA
ncbi:MAG: ParA family protein [Clostridiales bacterium]|nr:ParA family protein [Clostridiales bacterium]MBS5877827.1 ParA family protein [Clostridiales bacterium]